MAPQALKSSQAWTGLEGVPIVPPESGLSGSALGLWGQHLVQHAQHRPVAIASSAVSLRGGLQGSSSSPPSTSHCHAAIGCLKRDTLLQQADLSDGSADATNLRSCWLSCLSSCSEGRWKLP